MTFHVGQKVVCVDDLPSINARITRAPSLTKGQVFTIRDMEIWKGVLLVRLVEIVAAPFDFIDRGWLEPSWRASRFRPIVERKTDISIFTSMLNPSKQGVDA